jgi:hypothetical protein
MEKDVGKIKKNETADIIIRIDDYKGKKGLTIREYITSEKYTGFSKSGTRIPADEFLNFRDIINSIDLDELTSTSPSDTDKKEKKKKKADKKEDKIEVKEEAEVDVAEESETEEKPEKEKEVDEESEEAE